MTRSKLKEQIKFVACGNTAFAKGSADSIMIKTSAGSKKVQTSDNAASGFIDFKTGLENGVNWLDISGAKAYLKTDDSSAVAVLGDFKEGPVSQ